MKASIALTALDIFEELRHLISARGVIWKEPPKTWDW
jgi:hypothetical protein